LPGIPAGLTVKESRHPLLDKTGERGYVIAPDGMGWRGRGRTGEGAVTRRRRLVAESAMSPPGDGR
jgi:hypothetical protein